jgi:hypothetical protein
MEEVPEKLSSPVDYRIIISLIGAVIGFHIFVNFIDDPDTFVYGFSVLIPAGVVISSFVVARRYSGSLVFSKSYYFLGIGFAGIFLGELTYFIYEVFLEIDPYPSIADVFFFLFYPMVSLYMIQNIRFFSPVTPLWEKILAGIIPVSITLFYLSITVTEEINFDFFYGILFVSATSVSLAISIYALRIFRGSLMGTSWLILVTGILMLVGGDVWYYYIELFEEYTLSHLVNIFWYLGYLLILYSLIKHRSSI